MRKRRFARASPHSQTTFAPAAETETQVCVRLIVQALLQDLPPTTQRVAELVAEDCSEVEIAQQLGLGREVVRRHKRAIRKRLESVQANWGEP